MPLLFAMDVVYTQAAYEKGVQPGFHIDPVAGVRSIRRLKDLAAEHGADVVLLARHGRLADVQEGPRLLRALVDLGLNGGSDGKA